MKPYLEPIPLGQEKSILGFSYAADNFDTPWHFHPQHELTYIEESTGTKFIGDYVGSYEPGELVLLRSNLPHCWKNAQNGQNQSRSLVVQWNVGIFPKVPELQVVFDLLRTAAKGMLFDFKETKELIPTLKRLPSLEGHELYIQLLELLTALAKCPYRTLSEASFIDDLPTEYGSRMSTIHEFVSKYFERKIYLKEVADLVSLSEQSFSRFFSKMMGRSFFTFLNEYRINRASRMLLDTDYSVAEIGYFCGYESLPFFHKQFNKFKNCTPLVYRKKHGLT
ncbi:MAG: AraC family transcriptional regulator [Maribacter sp.]|uniref:AraC family transcriptional regulator n=1 Tax=Maribacter sp. 2307UL18-2 TaxID=3386274 RepID=UPI0039BD1D29